jgi:serine phosphatase RsbU (regulator of sigma subunit)
MNTDLLLRVPLFSGLPASELEHLAGTLRVLDMSPGAALFHEQEVGDELFIVITGQVEVAKGMNTPEEKILRIIGPGEYLGEMSLLTSQGQRSAGARAKDRCQLWVMTRADFDALLHRQPHMAYNMGKVLSERLAEFDASAFHDLVEKNRQLQKAYDELKAAQAQIIEKERLERELQLAAGIQVSILPHALPKVPGFEFSARMDPARVVGGDFYDVFPLDDDRIGVLVGDVAGKGVPAAIFMARTHALITAEALRGGTPGAVLRHVNQYLTRLEQTDLFVTVIYGILNCRSGELVYARGGHEIPLKVSVQGQVTELPHNPGMPIGVVPDFDLDEQSVTWVPGDILLLYTDGMCDCRTPQGEDFGRERLGKVLGDLAGAKAQAACDALVKTLLTHRGGADQDDDVTLVAIHATG